MTPKELENILKVMRKMGVLYLKTADLELSLSQDALTKKTRLAKVDDEPLAEKTSGHLGYTDEEVLFWPHSVEEAG